MTSILHNVRADVRKPTDCNPWASAALPLVHELIPAPDPVEILGRLAGLPHLLFLDSALKHPTLGRYSYLTADPFAFIESENDLCRVDGVARALQPGETPLDVLAARLRPLRGARPEWIAAFSGRSGGGFRLRPGPAFRALAAPAVRRFPGSGISGRPL